MAHVTDHLSIEELEHRYRACEDACSARHYQTIWLLAQGHTVSEVAALTSFVPRTRGSSAQQRHAPFGAQARTLGRAEGSAQGAAAGWRAMDEPQGRGLDGRSTWAREACAATRLGGAASDRLVDPVAAPAQPKLRHRRRDGAF